LGDYSGRYESLFTYFTSQNYMIKTLDMRGHGYTYIHNKPFGSIQGHLNGFPRIHEDFLTLLNYDSQPGDERLPVFMVN